MEDREIVFYLGSEICGIEKRQEGFLVKLRLDSGEMDQMEAEKIIVCTGRKANIHGLGLESAGIKTEGGRIAVDGNQQTSKPYVYAVGDCAYGPMLAHKAAKEADVR